MNERKYRIGQIVVHGLTKDKMMVIRNVMNDPCSVSYIIRRKDLTTLEVREEEIEESPYT